MAHFISLQKLPSAKEMAQLLVQHVFHLYGLPLHIVSNRRPQFFSVFWSEFCKLLGAAPSLSLSFLQQSNGQMERMNQDLDVALRCMGTLLHGSLSWHGWRMCITLYPARQWCCHHLSVCMVISLLCSYRLTVMFPIHLL